jgi:hypothetical protein
MKKDLRWVFILSFVFVVLSALVYALNYLIFRNPHEMFFLMLEDIGFMFLNVLVVILLIERLLTRREKRLIFKKLNMVIGTFYSVVGLELLARFSRCGRGCESLKKDLNILPSWSHKDFEKAAAAAKDFKYELQLEPDTLAGIKTFLEGNRNFLVSLLENPTLLEHDRFTDVLWAVFHLSEELAQRKGDLAALPANDYQHLMNDARRAYTHLTAEWIVYTEHLKESYPYLFSLATRINPFSPNPSAIIN